MNRFDLTSRLLAKLKNEEAVIGASATRISICGPPAIARRISTCWAAWASPPDRTRRRAGPARAPRFALEGDGSLLMQMGCLSTIASLKPKNLTMIVMDNGIYQITGAQPTPAAAVADIVAIAGGCGLANSAWAADEDDFERLVEQSLSASGPTLIGVRIDDKPGVGQPAGIPYRSESASCSDSACGKRYEFTGLR